MTPPDDFTHDHDHDQNAGGSEGDWVSSEPPVDDFGDEHAADESATVSEGDETAMHEQAAETVQEDEPKKFPFLLLIGVAGVLAVGGALAYWHFGGHRDEQGSILDMAARNASEENVPNYVSKPATTAVELPAPSAAPAASASDVAPKTSFSVPSANPETGAEAKKPATQTASVAPSPQPAPAANAAAEQAPAPSPAAAAPAEPALVTPAPSAPPAPLAAAPAQDEHMAALSSRIDDLQKSLGQTAQQLSQISEKLSAMQSPAPAADPAMQERLGRLEQKISELEQQKAAATARPALVDSVIPPRTAKKPKLVVSHIVVHHKRVVRTVHEGAKPAAAKPNTWVLRAATPGEAWVAKGAETRELRPVHVGDDLAGIGRVTAIKQVGDSWVVQGTHGTVR